MIVEKAFAKVNLFLDVISKRQDGFHEVKTVMHTISLCDDLYINAVLSDKTEIKLCVDESNLAADSSNLVYRAAQAYLNAANISATVDIKLEKHIPIAAGLGGGSSDCAATLRGLNKIFAALSDEEIYEISRSLGSDVPFFLFGGGALCGGRGDEIEPIESKLQMHLVVAIGDDRISTPLAYARLDRIFSDFDGSVPTGADSALDCLLGGISTESVPRKLFNIFETDIDKCAKSVLKIKAEMEKCGSTATLMSGSGPSVFGVFDSEERADFARDSLISLGISAFKATFC